MAIHIINCDMYEIALLIELEHKKGMYLLP